MPHITDPNEPYFKDGIWGWDGSVWRKLPLIWGYSNRYAEVESTNNATGGTDTLTFSVVPAGEIWVVTVMAATDRNTAITRIDLVLQAAASEIRFAGKSGPVAYELVSWAGKLVLKEGDYLIALLTGTALNDDLRAYAAGYKMLIAE